MLTMAMLAALCAPVELLSADEVRGLRAAVPRLSDENLERQIKSDDVLWYDERVMLQAYQDPIPPITGLRTPSSPIAPVEIFSGGRFRFPFGHTAGTHRCGDAVRTVQFLKLPRALGVLLPVVYIQHGLAYEWYFPKGTIVGEMMMVYAPNGVPYVFELRIRRREIDHWAVDAFRPFPTAERMAVVLEAAGGSEGLVRFLRNPKTLRPMLMRDSFGVLAQNAGVDVLPEIDDSLVASLLTTTTFHSCHGERWKADGDLECYAPTTNDPFSIVPANYDGGFFAVDDQSCSRCHQHAGQGIGDFDGSRVLYGRIWGNDQIISFHPLHPARAAGDADYGGPDVDLRREFLESGILAPYDRERHLPTHYASIQE